eukprot:GHVL01043615.1.p1 GENE.GHVL01043615.1~~GHVL01043615.1.p1  ORF type:complete len:840 (-),score=189.68 GHVL01043615.1:34-2460(-)
MLLPTIYYNMSIIEDIYMIKSFTILYTCINKYKYFINACKLLKLWIYKRRFIGFNGFTASILLAHIALQNNVQTTEIQLFKLALVCLANTNWKEELLILGQEGKRNIPPELTPPGGEHRCYLFDSAEKNFNFLFRVDVHIQEIQLAAMESVSHLDEEAEPFDEVFGITRLEEFDWDCRIVAPIPSMISREDVCESEWGLPQPLLIMRQFQRLINTAVDKCRCVSFRIALEDDRKSFDWSDSQKWSGFGNDENLRYVVVVGISLTGLPERTILGPFAHENYEKFKNFWGSKFEKRRFKDGSIRSVASFNESDIILYNCIKYIDSLKNNIYNNILYDILYHIFNIHMKWIINENFKIYNGILGRLEPFHDSYKQLWPVFTELKNDLIELPDLPLILKDVRASSEVFAYMEVPNVQPNGDIQFPICICVIEFETTRAWPDFTQIHAIRHLKAALLLSIKDAPDLRGKYECGVHFDGENEPFLDIKKDIYNFRINIYHPPQLSTDMIYTDVAVNWKTRPTDIETLRDHWFQPLMTLTYHSFVGSKPAFAQSVTVMKIWLSFNLLTGLEEHAQLIMAHIFTSRTPWVSPPTSPHTALCRFWWFLTWFDFSEQPLIVDLDESLNSQQRHLMQLAFEKSKNMKGTPKLWISTKFDPHSLLLPQLPRDFQITSLVSLAKSSLKTAKFNSNLDDLPSIFIPDIHKRFDFILHLKENCSNLNTYDGFNKEILKKEPFQEYISSIIDHFGHIAYISYNHIPYPYPLCICIHIYKYNINNIKPINSHSIIINNKNILNIISLATTMMSLGKGLIKSIQFL